jgi:hypothetical protein
MYKKAPPRNIASSPSRIQANNQNALVKFFFVETGF